MWSWRSFLRKFDARLDRSVFFEVPRLFEDPNCGIVIATALGQLLQVAERGCKYQRFFLDIGPGTKATRDYTVFQASPWPQDCLEKLLAVSLRCFLKKCFLWKNGNHTVKQIVSKIYGKSGFFILNYDHFLFEIFYFDGIFNSKTTEVWSDSALS